MAKKATKKQQNTYSPNRAAGYGFLFVLPFFIINFIVALRIEPFYEFLGAIPVLRSSSILPLLLLLLFPLGAYAAAEPMLKNKKIYLLNTFVAFILVLSFLILTYGLGSEFMSCKILQIPNCD